MGFPGALVVGEDTAVRSKTDRGPPSCPLNTWSVTSYPRKAQGATPVYLVEGSLSTPTLVRRKGTSAFSASASHTQGRNQKEPASTHDGSLPTATPIVFLWLGHSLAV